MFDLISYPLYNLDIQELRSGAMSTSFQKRPKNLNLLTIKFPVTAIGSILHRISGLFLFILLPFLLYCLQSSLDSYIAFDGFVLKVQQVWVKALIWFLSSAFIYHLFAGVKHLFMDLNIGVSLKTSKIVSWVVMVSSFSIILLLGVYIW